MSGGCRISHFQSPETSSALDVLHRPSSGKIQEPRLETTVWASEGNGNREEGKNCLGLAKLQAPHPWPACNPSIMSVFLGAKPVPMLTNFCLQFYGVRACGGYSHIKCNPIILCQNAKWKDPLFCNLRPHKLYGDHMVTDTHICWDRSWLIWFFLGQVPWVHTPWFVDK